MALWDEPNIELVFFWPLTASITLEVKNFYAYVKTPEVLNKFTEDKKFCRMYGLAMMMVVSRSTPIKNIDKINLQIN